jgi:hypothetical protein
MGDKTVLLWGIKLSLLLIGKNEIGLDGIVQR